MNYADSVLKQLQNRSQRAYFFGLGFIQVVINQELRCHFYHPSLPGFLDPEEPHDHRYSFRSTVLGGSLLNNVWEIDEGDEYRVDYEICKPPGAEDVEAEPPDSFHAGARFMGRFLTESGSGYFMQRDVFHTVEPIGITVTLLERGPVQKEFARILRKEDAEPVCPYSKPIEEAKLWDIVKECLGSLDKRHELFYLGKLCGEGE
jgi:hypothetical protein